MSRENVSMVSFNALGDDELQAVQISVAKELAVGRDVVVVCERDMLRREEILTLAQPALSQVGRVVTQSRSPRLAIVDSNTCGSENSLPSSISRTVRCFQSVDAAMVWLRPDVAAVKKTFLYFTVPTVPPQTSAQAG
jgi:hypothetical protein